jgi:hypothetical protein
MANSNFSFSSPLGTDPKHLHFRAKTDEQSLTKPADGGHQDAEVLALSATRSLNG